MLIDDSAAVGRDMLFALDALIAGENPDALTHINCHPNLLIEDVLPLVVQGAVVVIDHLNRASREFQLMVGQLVGDRQVLVVDRASQVIKPVYLPKTCLIAVRVKRSEGGGDVIPQETAGKFLFHIEFGPLPDAQREFESEVNVLACATAKSRFSPKITLSEIEALRAEFRAHVEVGTEWNRLTIGIANAIKNSKETVAGSRPSINALRHVSTAHVAAENMRRLWSQKHLFSQKGDKSVGDMDAETAAFYVATLAHRSLRRSNSPYSSSEIVKLALSKRAEWEREGAIGSKLQLLGDDAGLDKEGLRHAYNVYKSMNDHLRTVVLGRGQSTDEIEPGQKGLGTLNLMLTSLLGGGHLLLEDYPGTGKTFMVKMLADMIYDDVDELGINIEGFRRIQCVPDLMPGDLTGYEAYASGSTVFRKGPVFTYMLLLDEINRTTPKVQAAMLEAMAEKQVTVGDRTYKLGDIFFVLATQNPFDAVGTFPLTSAQLDRFLFKRRLKPVADKFVDKIIFSKDPSPAPKIAVSELVRAARALKTARNLSNEAVMGPYLRELAHAMEMKVLDGTFREGSKPSPRSLQTLHRALKAVALITSDGKDLDNLRVLPSHLDMIACDFFGHRVSPGSRYDSEEMSEAERNKHILQAVENARNESDIRKLIQTSLGSGGR